MAPFVTSTKLGQLEQAVGSCSISLRSVHTYGLRYRQYLGNGECKACETVEILISGNALVTSRKEWATHWKTHLVTTRQTHGCFKFDIMAGIWKKIKSYTATMSSDADAKTRFEQINNKLDVCKTWKQTQNLGPSTFWKRTREVNKFLTQCLRTGWKVGLDV